MMTRLAMVLALVLTCMVVEAPQAQAQCGAQGGYGYGFGYGFDVGRLYRVLSQNVPYYAAFPPVYYSAPIPRTYGYSPFAYPPGTATPELASPTVAAKEIMNPYVPASTTEEKPQAENITKQDIAPQPLAITNPYVLGEKLAEVSAPLSR